MRIAAIIPALNEEESIAGVLSQMPHEIVQQVIVVDNGSTDRTAEIARANGATVVREEFRGYGAACYAGVQAAMNADVLVFLDGDGADDPQEISLLVAPILAGEADLVLGSRTRGRHEPGALLPHARFGNWLAARLMEMLYGLKVSDLAPFRAIRRPELLALDMRERTYGWPTEMAVKSAKRGYRIVEIPISYRRRAGGKSKVSGTVRGTILAGYFILGTTIKHAWTR